jgi:hypothetical protein
MEKRVLKRESWILGVPVWHYARTEMVWKEVVSITEKRPSETIEEEKSTYVVGSWFLEDCWEHVCGKPVEDMHYVSGLRFGNYLTLERLTRFNLSSQSVAFVEGDLSSSFKSLMDIESHGYCLTAWFHSHPGRGRESAFASGTDMKTQRMLEAGRYQAIGAVFSQDGFVRFFTDRLQFNLMALGKGIEKIDENVYKISPN